jgi:hypothetical protein
MEWGCARSAGGGGEFLAGHNKPHRRGGRRIWEDTTHVGMAMGRVG